MDDPPIDYDYAGASARRALSDLFDRVPAFGVKVHDNLVHVTAFVTEEPDEQLLEDLSSAHSEMASDWPHVVRMEPEIRLDTTRADPAWDCLFEVGMVFVGPVYWSLGRKVQRPHRAPIVAELFAIANALSATPIGDQVRPPWIAGVLRDASPRVSRVENVEPFRAEAFAIVISRAEHGWISSYEQGWRTVSGAWISTAKLPADHHAAIDVLCRVESAVGSIAAACVPADSDAPRRCQFCGEQFAPLDFLADLSACHGCAVRNLGIVF